ncbi:cyclic nucleotide-gated ion channel 2-like isoform X2 [Andrographis paniculata]|uniref:cyclic nucleotide-gated ion channel 2-like isoform X2 n=1 Tax=Andrographis paniculata TaxID=175694 RepID=UPI0021E75F94|nr:cyclic nucleotide-gated ion channel 2-like isoform X2 [Andrographis paniculata]
MSEFCNRIFRLTGKNFRRNADDSPADCYACAQSGPVFHSTKCNPVEKPEWDSTAGSSLVPIAGRSGGVYEDRRRFIIDPRSVNVQRWNRTVVMARGVALAVDPLFLFAISIGGGGGGGRPCIYVDGAAAVAVAVVRSCVDLVHVCHLAARFRLAYVSRESLVVGCGKLVWDARAIASHYLKTWKGFWFDLFVVLPIPQAMYWLVVPKLIRENKIGSTMTILQLTFLLQFIPKVYHCFSLMRGMRKVTGYIFGTIWWGFGLNLIAYFLASHASGGYWYILAVRRIASCLTQQYNARNWNVSLSCSGQVCHSTQDMSCFHNSTTTAKRSTCLDSDGPFPYGIFEFALPLMTSNSFATKVLYSNLWGLMALSTMGNNLEPTSHCLEVLFSMTMVLAGLLLFTLLIGNIQVFLHAVMMRRRKMQLRYRDMEWWMNHRQLPSHLRRRVKKYEHQIWKMTGGQDENELIKDLPEGLRRDIKRHICLDLIRKVPLFHNLDDLILDNICDHVKPLVYSKHEKIIREGDPVKRMTFVVCGQVKRSQGRTKGAVATSILETGSFLGDELISWCLRRPFLDRLPASSATFVCTRPAEAYALEAEDLRYVIQHFRYHFTNDTVRRATRYYSSNWRTWAAVNIQLAWRRHVGRTRRGNSVENDGGGGGDGGSRRLRKYASMFLSFRPHDHLE